MQNQIHNFLNCPFPLFLALRKGRIYFIGMIFVLVALANILHAVGLAHIREMQTTLVLSNYIVVFFGMYALLYILLSILRPHHYNTDSWTLGKEFRILLLFLPVAACSSCLFVCFSVQEFDLTLPAFLHLQCYNGLLCAITLPAFGYFIHHKLSPSKPKGTPDEKQARKTLQKLHDVMKTEQLYLSQKCNLLLVSDHTGIPVHRISHIINAYTEGSFTDFVNKYRVEHVCRILQEDNKKRLKLGAIGMECGFGSKVNFYQVFKKVTGKTPAEYLADL